MATLIEEREAKRLNALSQYQILDSPPEPAFDDLTALAAGVCETPISLITFLDGNREWFKSKVGVGLAEVPRQNAFCAHTIHQTDVMVVPDATRDARFAHNPLVTGEPHIRFYAGYPLLSKDGEGLGALCVLDSIPHNLTPQQKQLLRKLGHEATALLQMRRDNLETRHHEELQAAELKRLQEDLVREIEEHRRAEEGLLRRERQLADAQRLAVLGSWEWDLATDSITWSDELFRIFGIPPKSSPANYEEYLKWIHPDDRPRTDEIIKNTLLRGGSFIHEKRIVRSDGAVRTLNSCGEVILDDRGRPLRMVGYAQDITERKETEQKLRDTVSLLHSTLESTADGILVVDLNGRLAGWNKRFTDMWRLPTGLLESKKDDLILSRVLEQLKDPEAFLARVRELYAASERDSFDTIEFKDGRTFERFSHPQRREGEIVGRVWSFRDVTERYRSTEVLRQNEERYRSLVTASSQVVWIAAPDGGVLSDNVGWKQFSGQTGEELAGYGWLEKVHPADRARVKQTWATAVTNRSFYQIEFRVLRADNEWRHFLNRAVPVFEKDGSVREWIGAALDITDRKNAEQVVVNERDFSNALINSLPGTFYLVDESGTMIKWNKNFELVTGYSAEELNHMPVQRLIAPEDVSIALERMQQAFTEGEADVEISVLTKTGEKHPYFCTGRRVNINTKPCVVGVGIDIAERRRIEEEIKRLNQDLEGRVRERTMQLDASNKDLQSFSYTISHDLKAPLRAITGFAEALQEDCRHLLDEEQNGYLNRITQATDRMGRLIEDLLTYSRIGRSAVHLRPLPLQEFLIPLVEDFRFLVERTGGSISLQPDFPSVLADKTLLTQAITNLMENAIKYRKTDVPLQLSITWQDEGREGLVIRVNDNGIGIDPIHHRRIFEVFQRLHRNEDYPGTGIGLANVRKAVEMQGGSVWVESQPGKGSTFCVKLKRPKAEKRPPNHS